MKIDYPNESEIQQTINIICDKGIKKHETAFSFIKNMTTALGFKTIFYGMYDVIFIAFSVTAAVYGAVFYPLINIPNNEEKIIFSTLLTAPLLFALLFILSFLKEKSSDTFNVKMACKYTVYHLLSYRMFVFSLLSVITNTFYLALVAVKFKINVVTVLSVSLSELFVFSAILTVLLTKLTPMKSILTLTSIWCAVNVLFYVISKTYFTEFIKAVPIIVWALILSVSAVIYLKKLPQIIVKGRNIYAYS